MLCMDEPARRMWCEGKFALEPLDDDIDHLVEPSSDARDVDVAGTGAGAAARKIKIYGLRMRFYWLKRTTLEFATDPADFDTDPSQIVQSEGPDAQERLFDVDGRPIETGHIIDVFSHEKDRLPDKHIVQLQWDVLRMYALSGGAAPGADSVPPPSDDDDDWASDRSESTWSYASYAPWEDAVDPDCLSDEEGFDPVWLRKQLSLKRRRDFNLPSPPSSDDGIE
ncbi:hypothetical protein CSOJ01_04780 [Colletotrichum sojae]|uniref:Uncharacterized protein n=1 Tax=Colletotrichum sojae TaxID=2175907 RepID=A0A8H6MXV3_9PEZI|nr:hypothetical protein CSOJ01_04780 [Colletotrichum sojae]